MDDLGEVGVLNDLQIVGFSRPFVGHRADLGHTVMIKYPRVGPGVLDAFACGGNAAADSPATTMVFNLASERSTPS